MQMELTFNNYLPRKKEKGTENFIFGWYMPIINRTPVHNIAQLMKMFYQHFIFLLKMLGP